MPVLVEADGELARELAHSLPPGSTLLKSLAELDQWLSGTTDHAVVLGPSVDLDAAAAFADHYRLTQPATSVILIRQQLANDVFSRAMQAGIGSVLATDDLVGLAQAVNRARQTWEAIHGPSSPEEGHRKGKVLTVFSPKGGVGKTTLAVNLGLALAQHGQKICIIDLDLSFGDVAITLQLIPSHTIAEAAEVGDAVDYAMLQDLLTSYDPSVQILAAPTSPEGHDRIRSSLVRQVIQALRSQYDFLVIDTAPGFDEAVLQAFDETDECVVVATLDVPTIKNTKMAMETLDLLRLVKDRRHLVLNRADDEVGLTSGSVEKILDMPIEVALPSSRDVPLATNHGKPLVASRPDHEISRAILELAGRFAGVTAPLPATVSAGPAKRSLFGRRK